MKTNIENACQTYTDAIRRYHEDQRSLADAKERLTEEYSAARLAGRIEGKNEADREAMARHILQEHYERVASAEDLLNRSRERLEIAKIEYLTEMYLIEAAKVGLNDMAPSVTMQPEV